ncbi:MAG: ribose uptake protein RbsU [Acetilactobacillus jinshanensis]
MNILIAILPALLWGSGPILATLVGGKPIQQVTGTCYGQLIIGILLYLIFRPSIPFEMFLWPFLGGLVWAIAQLMQFTSFKQLNVSIAMPISTGLQLIEIPLAGVIFWGEWNSAAAKLAGFIAILVLIVGICMASINDHSAPDAKHMDYKGGLTMLIVGSFGYTACSVFPKITNASGMTNLMPQTLGMFLGGALMAWYYQAKSHDNILTSKVSLKNACVGLFGGIGTFCYLYALSKLGPATAFPLTQMNVIVSTLGGIFILHEHKDHKEMCFIIAGLILIIGAATVIARLYEYFNRNFTSPIMGIRTYLRHLNGW